MKRTIKYIFAAFGLVLAGAAASAEEVKPGIHLDKTLTANDDGTYTITLESYVTGSVTTTPAPLDIALVLDVTSSMSAHGGGGQEPLPQMSPICKGNEIDDVLIKATTGYNKYHETCVTTGRTNKLKYTIDISGTNYNLAYFVNNTKYGDSVWGKDTGWYYSTSTTTSAQKKSGKVDNTWQNNWTKYTANSANHQVYTDVKIDHLMKNVKAFIDTIHEKSLQLEDGGYHRITIIPFAKNDNTIVDQATELTNASTGQESLKTFTSGLWELMASGTNPERGFAKAKSIFDASGDPDRKKVVVFFTDGKAASTDVAVNGAYTSLKSADIPIFAVGLYEKPTSTLISNARVNDGTGTKTKNATYTEYTSWISSDYPDAQYADNVYNIGAENPNDTEYSFSVDNAEALESVFNAISEVISGLVDLHGTSTSVVDVVSKDFELPEGFDDADVRCHVETCVGENQWAKAGETGYDYDNNYNGLLSALSVGVKNQQIDVHGFDFSKEDDWETAVNGAGNFVGEREGRTNAKGNDWFGNKLVIEFEVVLKEDHTAGYELPSNDIMSGIYEYREDQNYNINDQIAAYPRPTIDSPAICIVKEGLAVGESAIFTVEGGGKSFRVILTQKESDTTTPTPCFVVIRDLPENQEYTVTETYWTYAYDLTNTNGSDDETANRAVTKTLEKPTHTGMTGDQFKNEIKSKQHTSSPAYDDKYYVANDAVNLLFRFVNKPSTTPLHGEDAQLNQFGNQTIDPGHKEPGEDIE